MDVCAAAAAAAAQGPLVPLLLPHQRMAELQSDRSLGSGPPRGARRRHRRRRRRRNDKVDRISGLPDDMIREVLVRLRCTSSAARTSVLSSRWRGLWRHLPELSFREIPPDAIHAALAQVTRTELSLLDINVPECHKISSPGVASLLHAAARLAPVELSLIAWANGNGRGIAIEGPWPCFHRTTSIKLDMRNPDLYLTPSAPGAVFPVLERLSIAGCHFDTGALVRRCPCLRVLEVRNSGSLGTIMVHSPTIKELDVGGEGLEGINIVAPALKRFTMSSYKERGFNVSFSAPAVDNLSWHWCYSQNAGIGEMWRLRELNFWMEESICVLRLTIGTLSDWLVADRNLMQDVAQLPEFSVLELSLATYDHIYGAIVLNILEGCTSVKRLKVDILCSLANECSPNCPCDEPQDWRTQSISLMALEEVEIKDFNRAGHEVDFLKLLFRCAPLMKMVTVRLSPKVSPSSRGCKKMYNFFKAYPSVKCYVYDFFGKQVLYA
uniref:F-box domain-containing protein n=1 Tax=Arundo donax TaxID=35708 RepID=A0A0A9EMI0_ARUDO